MGQTVYDIFLVDNDCLQEGLESLVWIVVTVGERIVQFEPEFEVRFTVL